MYSHQLISDKLPAAMVLCGLVFFFLFSSFLNAQNDQESALDAAKVVPAAERIDYYLPLMQNKTVGLVVNQTSMCGQQHLVDELLSRDVSIKTIFAPEHGFRGTADAGATIKDSKDDKTGLPVVSLYGKNKKPSAAQLAGLDVIIFDIQDVGARFYTYISTLHYVMEAAAENELSVIVLDRPNPNGHYVDGPVLDPAFRSFVGMHEIPVVHGMTVGELACMINGEGWLKGGISCTLDVIPCKNYQHQMPYTLPVRPSPNLPNATSIYLYPSLCFFEGTDVSVGRGTDKQFQVLGAPTAKGDFAFTPEPKPGAKYPKHQGRSLLGEDLSQLSAEAGQAHGFQLSYLLKYFEMLGPKLFTKADFFDKLAGNASLREMILAGKSESEIRASWEPELSAFKELRAEYLLYE